VLNGVAQREDTTLALCLITHIGVLQQAVLSAGGLLRPQWRGISPEASCKVLPLLISPFGPCPPSRWRAVAGPRCWGTLRGGHHRQRSQPAAG
jgi:hypothetical protein